MQYENRIVLFLDILGFKKHIEDTVDKAAESDKFEVIESLYNALQNMGIIARKPPIEGSTVQATQFSDSIVISFLNAENSDAVATFKKILRIIISLIRNKILCRGALSVGKFIHTPRVMFGPALIDAYESETRAAMYPRIIMDKSIYNKTRDPFGIGQGVDGYITKDFDEKYYIDYFQAPATVIKQQVVLENYYTSLRSIIVKGRQLQSPDLKVKYGWMKGKFNDFLRKINTGEFETVLSAEFLSFLTELKKVR